MHVLAPLSASNLKVGSHWSLNYFTCACTTELIEAMYVSLATHRTYNHATIKYLEKHNKITVAIYTHKHL